MSALLTAVMVIGIAANVIGALCIIVSCLAWLGFMMWVLTNPALTPTT